MLDGVLIEAAGKRGVRPGFIRDFLVAHLAAEHALKRVDDIAQRNDVADDGVGAAWRDLRACQRADGDARDIFG